jgi:hypothetical protein
VELQIDLAVEIDAQGVMVAVTHWFPLSFRQEVVENAGFPGTMRKRHAETIKPSGKSRYNQRFSCGVVLDIRSVNLQTNK